MLNPNPVLISQIKLVLGLNPRDDLIVLFVDSRETLTSAQTDHVGLQNLLTHQLSEPPPLSRLVELHEILVRKT